MQRIKYYIKQDFVLYRYNTGTIKRITSNIIIIGVFFFFKKRHEHTKKILVIIFIKSIKFYLLSMSQFWENNPIINKNPLGF